MDMVMIILDSLVVVGAEVDRVVMVEMVVIIGMAVGEEEDMGCVQMVVKMVEEVQDIIAHRMAMVVEDSECG